MSKVLRIALLIVAFVIAQPVQAQQAYNGVVASEVGGLRLRQAPSETAAIINVLAPNTQLRLVGRTTDNGWLDVFTPQNQRGWVGRLWIRTQINLAALPVTTLTVAAAPAVTAAPPVPTTPAAPALININAPSTKKDFAVISGVSENAHQIFLRGQQQGNRADVFSKVGDSITAGTVPSTSPFLVPFGRGQYNLGAYADLQPVIDQFSKTKARDDYSFANTSLAARAGWPSWMALSVPKTPTAPCNKDETPLACEYRLVKPSVALIMFGTNDVKLSSLATYEKYMRLIIETSRDNGVIPVVSTIPPINAAWGVGRAEVYNAIVIKLAREYDIPLIDYYSVMRTLPYDGLTADGVHPSMPPYLQFANFTDKNLQYGYTLRNLLTLQALDKVWREALHP